MTKTNYFLSGESLCEGYASGQIRYVSPEDTRGLVSPVYAYNLSAEISKINKAIIQAIEEMKEKELEREVGYFKRNPSFKEPPSCTIYCKILESPYFHYNIRTAMVQHHFSAVGVCLHFLNAITDRFLEHSSDTISYQGNIFAVLFEVLLQHLRMNAPPPQDGARSNCIYILSEIDSNITDDLITRQCAGLIVDSPADKQYVKTIVNGLGIPAVGIYGANLGAVVTENSFVDLNGEAGTVTIYRNEASFNQQKKQRTLAAC